MTHPDRWTNRRKVKKISVDPSFLVVRVTLNTAPPLSRLLHCFTPEAYFRKG